MLMRYNGVELLYHGVVRLQYRMVFSSTSSRKPTNSTGQSPCFWWFTEVML